MRRGATRTARPELADRLHSAAIHLLRRARRTDPLTGVSAAQLSALSVLMSGPKTLGELAAAEQVRAPTMSRLRRETERTDTARKVVDRPVHVGNLRSCLLADWLRRTFELLGNRVVAVKNITDVGHMRQDALAQGEDKVIAAALAAGKTPKEIAEFYEAAFHVDERRLGILPATHFPRATDHVPEMVALVERLVARGFAYEIEGTVYFAVKRFPGYGRLSGNVREALRQGVRAELDPRKRDPADFALWKRAEADRSLVWDSPLGPGFSGRPNECFAMSIPYLWQRFHL